MRALPICFSLATFVASSVFASVYDNAVLHDRPVLYLPLAGAAADNAEPDLALRRQHTGRYLPAGRPPGKTRLPNGDYAAVFDGISQYLEVKSSPELSVRRGGGLTLEAWIRPDTLDFPRAEGDGYVHWAGKGESGDHEYAMRMYSKQNSASRPNRISGYVFNLAGGLGSGSYFQDPVRQGEWIHVAMVIDYRDPSRGTVSIYKNGQLRKVTPLSQFNVSPEAGVAPLRIGTRDLGSFFKGAIGKFAIYRKILSAPDLAGHYRAMNQRH